jgi:hypothetical protein
MQVISSPLTKKDSRNTDQRRGMKKQDFLKLMEFPQAWTDLEMYHQMMNFFMVSFMLTNPATKMLPNTLEILRSAGG